MEGSSFNFYSVNLFYYHLQKTSLKRIGSSNIYYLKWLKKNLKKTAINSKNKKDDKCFQYAMIAALHHDDIKNHSEHTSNLEEFISDYNLKEIDFPSHSKAGKSSNKTTIQLLLIFCLCHTILKRLAYKSKHNFKFKNQVILLMITNGKKWHYLAVKKTADITYRNNIKSWGRLLLLKLFSFMQLKK